jgi:hypothetical protein
MTSEKYLNKLLAGGDLIEQLKVHAKEYDGPCGQSATTMQANQIKKDTLLKAANNLEHLTTAIKKVLIRWHSGQDLNDYLVELDEALREFHNEP